MPPGPSLPTGLSSGLGKGVHSPFLYNIGHPWPFQRAISLFSLSYSLFLQVFLSLLVVLCSFQVVGLSEALGQQGGPPLVSGKGMDHSLSFLSFSFFIVSSHDSFFFHVAIPKGVKVGPSIFWPFF